MLNVYRLSLLALLFLSPLGLMAQEAPLEPVAVEEQTDRFVWEFVKMILLLGGMVLLMLLVSWYVKRLGSQRFKQTNQDNLIKIIEQRTLSPRSLIYLVEVEGKSFLIGETPHGLVRLSENWDS